MKKFKFREIRNGEKLKKGTVLTHKTNQKDRLVVTRNHDGGGYSLFVKFVGKDFEYSNQSVSQYLIVSPAKPETPKQTIKRLTAELAASVAKNEADVKASNERRDSVAKAHQDQVKYYEARLNDTRAESEKQAARARAAEAKVSDATATIVAMKSTIQHLGIAVQSVSGIARG